MTPAHLPLHPGAAWSDWATQPAVLAAASAVTVLYGLGMRGGGARAIGGGRAVSFAAGVAVVVAATMSPLHAAAEATFTGHMSQHLLLTLVAAPLLVLGRPGLVVWLAVPARMRRVARRAGTRPPATVALRLLRSPLAVLLAYAGVLWVWHLPGPYEAAVTGEWVHALEHATFVGVAMAFWSLVLRAGPRRRAGHVASILVVLGTMLHGTWLAATITFAGDAYPVYARRAPSWSVDPVSDQQLAGTLMWVSGTLVGFGLFAILFVRWFAELDAAHRRSAAADGPGRGGLDEPPPAAPGRGGLGDPPPAAPGAVV